MKSFRLPLYYNTIRYLKWGQIRYQVWYRFRSKWRDFTKFKYPLSSPSHPVYLEFTEWIDKPESAAYDTFRFLNLSAQFENFNIQWGIKTFGKLWTYNLNYMDFLLQTGMRKYDGVLLIEDFIHKLDHNATGLEPYPISLRGINWIKFLSKHKIQNKEIGDSLFAQYKILIDNLEYNLSGNHLLENGFSLLFGAFYFNDIQLFKKAKIILESELHCQVLDDGGHCELSPMYHQIILDRILDCINLLKNNRKFEGQDELKILMNEKIVRMLTWLNCMTFSNGKIPLLNDSAYNIAPSTRKLNDYASRLNIKFEKPIPQSHFISTYSRLNDSGYRHLKGSDWECIIDIGKPGSDYQPGHAHADTFNFELWVKGKPIIVDTGISTYEKNERRQLERGTGSHNTVQVDNYDSSQIWDGFRMARRAKIIKLEEKDSEITAVHDGYRKLGVFHERAWSFSDNILEIKDNIKGNERLKTVARIHLFPDVIIQNEGNHIFLDGLEIDFTGQNSIEVNDYLYASQYNTLVLSKVIEITFNTKLNSVFHFN